MQQLCDVADVQPLGRSDTNVCIIERYAADCRLTFVLNNYPEPKAVTGLPRGQNILADQACDGNLDIEPFGVAVIRS